MKKRELADGPGGVKDGGHMDSGALAGATRRPDGAPERKKRPAARSKIPIVTIPRRELRLSDTLPSQSVAATGNSAYDADVTPTVIESPPSAKTL